ncbi:hypothetical protein [Clostridium sp.]|uniref:hypothetical protein n=1 Tax=Clostridium sp. TaxID=1506 RepID=UPI0025BC0A43|nr:hypothetical protein [Clostridium sp.]
MKRKIFIEGEDPNERAYIGWQDEALSLQGVKKGYKNSANVLVDRVIEQGNKGRIDILDTYIFPIVFLYRHSIEISLKHIYFRVCGKLPSGGHDLLTIWDKIDKDIFNYFNNTSLINKVEKNEIKKLLKELQADDTHCEIWRYLISKEGRLYFSEWDFIDYRNLKNTLNWLYEELEGIYYYLDDMLLA